MNSVASLFESVLAIGVLWLIAAGGLLLLGRRGARAWRRRRDCGGERGFDYTLNLIATIPVLGLLVLLLLDCSMILTTKLGTLYAAYTAARSGVVWEIARSGRGPAQGDAGRRARPGAVLQRFCRGPPGRCFRHHHGPRRRVLCGPVPPQRGGLDHGFLPGRAVPTSPANHDRQDGGRRRRGAHGSGDFPSSFPVSHHRHVARGCTRSRDR